MGFPKGNKFASHDKPWTRALEKYAAQNPDKLAALARRVFDDAEKGDIAALREIGDRLDGKPRQTIDANVKAEMTVILGGDDTKL